MTSFRPMLTALVAMMIVAVPAAIVIGATPVSAHSQLVSSNPPDGAVLDAAPSAIEMVFSDTVLEVGGIVVVADAAGTNWADGSVVILGNTVSQQLKPDAPDGAYQVRWRVVSADGDPISDVLDYSIGQQAPAIVGPAGVATPPAILQAEDTTAAATVDPASIIPPLAIGGAALGIGAYALVVAAIRRRTPHP